MNKDVILSIERLDNRCFLSANPWYVDAIKADLIWSSIGSLSNKPVVANSYSAATKSYNGFSVSLNTKFFTKKKNLVEVRIKDSNVTVVAYKNYISR